MRVNCSAAAAKSLQSCPTLCDPRNGSPPGTSVPGILQARTLEWVAISFANAWKWKVKVKLLSRVWLFVTPWTAEYQAPPSMGFSRQEHWSGVPLPSPVLVAQSCSTLCNPMDCSPPGSSVHGLLWERILEWGTIPFSSGSFQPRDQTRVSCIAGRFFIIWSCPAISLLGILPERNENIHPHKDWYAKVHSNIILNRQKWKQLKHASTGEWINEMWYVYTNRICYSTIKRNVLIMCYDMDKHWTHYAKLNLKNINYTSIKLFKEIAIKELSKNIRL